MTVENLLLGVVIAGLAAMLYRSLGKDAEKKQKTQHKVRLVSAKTGEIIEMRLLKPNTSETGKNPFDDEFLTRMKFVFKTVCESFASGNLSALKNYTEPAVFNAYSAIIKKRAEKKEKMEFSLICFDSVKVEHISPKKDTVTVSFVTEQINLLRNAQDEVTEGDPMSVAKVRDSWTFRKNNRNKWVLAATQSEGIYD